MSTKQTVLDQIISECKGVELVSNSSNSNAFCISVGDRVEIRSDKNSKLSIIVDGRESLALAEGPLIGSFEIKLEIIKCAVLFALKVDKALEDGKAIAVLDRGHDEWPPSIQKLTSLGAKIEFPWMGAELKIGTHVLGGVSCGRMAKLISRGLIFLDEAGAIMFGDEVKKKSLDVIYLKPEGGVFIPPDKGFHLFANKFLIDEGYANLGWKYKDKRLFISDSLAPLRLVRERIGSTKLVSSITKNIIESTSRAEIEQAFSIECSQIIHSIAASDILYEKISDWTSSQGFKFRLTYEIKPEVNQFWNNGVSGIPLLLAFESIDDDRIHNIISLRLTNGEIKGVHFRYSSKSKYFNELEKFMSTISSSELLSKAKIKVNQYLNLSDPKAL